MSDDERPNDSGLLHSASNPTVLGGAYTVIAVLRDGVLAVPVWTDAESDGEPLAEPVLFVDFARLDAAEAARVYAWGERGESGGHG